jgi:hypothetical protein
MVIDEDKDDSSDKDIRMTVNQVITLTFEKGSEHTFRADSFGVMSSKENKENDNQDELNE